jgi:hypothetical protein
MTYLTKSLFLAATLAASGVALADGNSSHPPRVLVADGNSSHPPRILVADGNSSHPPRLV